MNTLIFQRCLAVPRTPVLSGATYRMIASVLLMGAFVGGCSKALPPTFRAVGVREVGQENERSVIEFLVEATNPNKEPIPMRQITYRVELDGVEVFSGVRSPETTLHTFSSHVFVLPAVLPLGAMSGSTEVNYAILGSALYIPPGRLSEVLFDAEIKVPEAMIDLSGTITLGGDQSAQTQEVTQP